MQKAEIIKKFLKKGARWEIVPATAMGRERRRMAKSASPSTNKT
jgi:hypothetical protein